MDQLDAYQTDHCDDPHLNRDVTSEPPIKDKKTHSSGKKKPKRRKSGVLYSDYEFPPKPEKLDKYGRLPRVVEKHKDISVEEAINRSLSSSTENF
jgi:hypothetical protein